MRHDVFVSTKCDACGKLMWCFAVGPEAVSQRIQEYGGGSLGAFNPDGWVSQGHGQLCPSCQAAGGHDHRQQPMFP